MTPRATIYNIEVELADNDRSVYESLKLTIAKHQSENVDFMLARMIAYCCEYREGIAFSKGLDEPEQPAIWAHSLSGEITLWVEIGVPSAEKLHRASKTGADVAVYTHRNPAILMQQLEGQNIHRSERIKIYAIPSPFLNELGQLIEKRTSISLSVSDETLFLDIGDQHLSAKMERIPL